jgi:hypothetical protein
MAPAKGMFVPIPESMASKPIFASKPQKGSREVMVNDKRWVIGSDHPLNIEGKLQTLSAFDIRHGKLIFILLHEFKMEHEDFHTKRIDWNRTIQFSVYELCQKYYGYVDGKRYDAIKALLFDLEHTLIKIHDEEARSAVSFKILSGASYRERYNKKESEHPELWLEHVTLDPNFIIHVLNLEKLLHIRLDVLLSLSNQLAAAIYTYIPSRAFKASKDKPFTINLSTLFEQLGESVPKYKSQRKEKLKRNRGRANIDILRDLDGQRITNGVLRVVLADTADKKDYKLLFWAEEKSLREKKFRTTDTYKIWRETNKSEESFDILTRKLPALEFDEIEIITSDLGIDLGKSHTYLMLAKAIIGEYLFNDLLGDIKQKIMENKNVGNAFAYFTWGVEREIRDYSEDHFLYVNNKNKPDTSVEQLDLGIPSVDDIIPLDEIN